MLTCTWAPTVFNAMQLARPDAETAHASAVTARHRQAERTASAARRIPRGESLVRMQIDYVARLERLGISHLLIAQRWWGSGEEMEGSSLDCLAATALIAAASERIQLVTAIHPGFFQPTAIAKWGATIDAISNGRWSVNVTSGWNMTEFEMYGIDPLPHSERYARSAEFIRVLRGAWDNEVFDFDGRYYTARNLRLEPRPAAPLTIFQGGQSEPAIAMAAAHSDWMFLNGGDAARTAAIIDSVRRACRSSGRQVRFALHANPLVRDSDADAWAEIDRRVAALDPARVAQRRAAVAGGATHRAGASSSPAGASSTPAGASFSRAGAVGMWSSDDALSMLDSNEGYASRLIGSPATVLAGIQAFADLGVEMLHLTLADPMFIESVLPKVHSLQAQRSSGAPISQETDP